MMQNDDEMMDNKKAVLMDLLSKMKELQAMDAKGGSSDQDPHGLALEVHEAHVEPLSHDDVEKLEEATHTDLDNDNEEGESPEHRAAVLGPDADQDMGQDDMHSDMDEEQPLPPELMALLQQHLMNKK